MKLFALLTLLATLTLVGCSPAGDTTTPTAEPSTNAPAAVDTNAPAK